MRAAAYAWLRLLLPMWIYLRCRMRFHIMHVQRAFTAVQGPKAGRHMLLECSVADKRAAVSTYTAGGTPAEADRLTKSAVSASAARTVRRAPPTSPRHSCSVAARCAAAC